MQIKKLKWAHFDERSAENPVEYLVIHCFAYQIEEIILLWDKMKVGPHYVIDEHGAVLQFVPEDKAARHAGKSFWRGETSLNAKSIGIEIFSPSFGQEVYNPKQIETLKTLAKDIIKRYNIRPQNVIGHSDIAPERKVDPGTAFPWQEMAKFGIGLWPANCEPYASPKSVKTLLSQIGYDVSNEKAALLAFMRHFMPYQITKENNIFKMEELLSAHINACPQADAEIKKCLEKVANIYTKTVR